MPPDHVPFEGDSEGCRQKCQRVAAAGAGRGQPDPEQGLRRAQDPGAPEGYSRPRQPQVLRHGRVLLPQGVYHSRGQAGGRFAVRQRQQARPGGQEGKSQGHSDCDGAM